MSHLKRNEIPPIIIGKLMNISGIMQREGNRTLLPYDMNQQQFSILFEIWKAGKVKQKEMVNRLMLEKAHVSKVVKKLEQRGILKLSPTEDDKRSYYIECTQEGKQLVKEIRTMFGEWNAQWFSEYSEEELLELLTHLDRLQKCFVAQYTEK